MGATQSTDGSEIVGDTHGYHVMQVVPNSPAFKAGLEVYFDYITHVNGMRLDREPMVLASQIRSNIGSPVRLVVFNSKTVSVRDIVVIPEKNDYGLLGCSVRFCDFNGVQDHIWHIIAVHADSPAETAGLCPQTDYIIGTPHTSLEDKDEFYTLVKKHSGIPLQLYVYNSELDTIREVLIVPNTEWKGEGLLGCDVGYGRLHRISRGKLHSSSPGSNGQDHTGHHHDDASSKDREHSHSHINGEGLSSCGHDHHKHSHKHDDHDHDHDHDHNHKHDHDHDHNHKHDHGHNHDHDHDHNHDHDHDHDHSNHQHAHDNHTSHSHHPDEHQGTPPAAAAAATMPTACTDPIHHPGHHDEHNISSQRPSSESNPDMESNALPATELDHLLHALDHTQQ
ncbi:hypothetical protein BASA62_008065 [Batrachochytrium salamandrivorans]|nr:hypothetical protein BASA62_008065 [Batrachochytrium salamandrivorans]